ncbi:hypothetical protein, partial [uncultured Alistipes sp.]|uniref:hypothetical protein n=1 Tax=uncultured Alistipes sp. TaxID=538949 RepID=UPI002621F85A
MNNRFPLGLHFTCAMLGLDRRRLGKMQTSFAFPLGLHFTIASLGLDRRRLGKMQTSFAFP